MTIDRLLYVRAPDHIRRALDHGDALESLRVHDQLRPLSVVYLEAPDE